MWTDSLEALDACNEAIEWAATQPDLATAWATCPRGDWMAWLLGRLSGPPESAARKRLVFAAADCAELALPYAGTTREALEHCLATTRAWARDEATIEELRAARSAAYAYADAAARAALAAAAYAAAYAAAAANAAAKHAEVLAQCADIVRRHYPTAPSLEKEGTE